MSERTRDDTTDEREREPSAERSGGALLTRTLLRIGLAVLGIILLLFALGQAFGVDLLGPAALLAAETRRWSAIALLALVLIQRRRERLALPPSARVA